MDAMACLLSRHARLVHGTGAATDVQAVRGNLLARRDLQSGERRVKKAKINDGVLSLRFVLAQ